MTKATDLFIIGGGINGCAIARDAAGRGISLTLAEMNDLASATSSASTKLFHGGLRYLEYFELRLVHEALQEREVLLRAMPHIAWPMRFVLPLYPEMRFDTATPASRLVGLFMPWLRGRRPSWMIRAGLFLYDHMGGRKILPGTTRLDLTNSPEGAPLQDRFEEAFEYSDVWAEDSRLVALTARDAETRGARILTRTRVTSARREGDLWRIETEGPDGPATHHARLLVNAAGPWTGEVLHQQIGQNSQKGLRLVRGSHIVIKKLFDHDKAYFLQGEDGRIIFAIPYEHDFTLIGTTEADHPDPATPPICTKEERDYLLDFASHYFRQALTPEDVVWTYSGVRGLYDDGAKSATAATRDYVLDISEDGPPLLNVFGGKITTHRRLAEAALTKIARHFPGTPSAWTARACLPGGDFPLNGREKLTRDLMKAHLFLTPRWADRLTRAYGTDARLILAGAKSAQDLGPSFGATLTGAEVDWLMTREFARNAEDVLWRRSKLGLRLTPAQVAELDRWMQERQKKTP